ncbi:hypothetical protein D6V26_20080 [Vibrio cholerae]|nr:hypothetical protein [Vibrio cholerae]
MNNCKCKNKNVVDVWCEYDYLIVNLECADCLKRTSIELMPDNTNISFCEKCGKEDLVLFDTDVFVEDETYTATTKVLCFDCKHVSKTNFN